MLTIIPYEDNIRRILFSGNETETFIPEKCYGNPEGITKEEAKEIADRNNLLLTFGEDIETGPLFKFQRKE